MTINFEYGIWSLISYYLEIIYKWITVGIIILIKIFDIIFISRSYLETYNYLKILYTSPYYNIIIIENDIYIYYYIGIRENKSKHNNKCIICLDENNKKIVTLECNHDYHEECVQNWINNYNNSTCPICRKEIKSLLKLL